MATTLSTDNRSLMGGGAEEDRTSAAHFLVGASFLLVGGVVQVFQLFALRFPWLAPVDYGRVEGLANLVLMIGFLVISLVGGAYYVLPRLTGVRLWNPGLARGNLILLASVVAGGGLLVLFGFGGGRPPFAVPWWLHVPMLIALSVPAVITVMTVKNRRERHSYVSITFIIAGTTWLPLLYLAYFAGELPGLGSLAVEYSNLFFIAGFSTMFVFTVGTGLLYYSTVKELDIPLASRQLATIGLWAMGFAGVWWGISQLTFGPGPDWVSGVAVALGLAFPIGALSNAANLSLTLEGHWEDLADKPGVTSGVIGLYLAVVVAVMAAFGSFPAIASATTLTAFWEAVEYAAISGVGALLVAGIVFDALPRVSGRKLSDASAARTFNRFTVIGVGGVLATLTASGLVSGYSWIAGSNTAAYVDAGEGWAAGAGAADPLNLIALGFAVITFLGQLAYFRMVSGTLFSGEAVSQEILVDRAEDEEDE